MSTTNQVGITTQEKELDKFLAMMKSTDEEMIMLGITLTFEKGESWIAKNIPFFGPGTIDQDYSVIRVRGNHTIYYYRGAIGCTFQGGVIDFRYLHDFPPSHKFKEI